MEIKKNIEIIVAVFKSIDYTRHIYKELKSDFCKVDGWDVGTRIILNDARPEVIDYVKTLDIDYTIYNDKNINDAPYSRVYRCYNHAVKTSKYDNVCFVNSDMAFSKNWLKNLLKNHDGKHLPCSRAVESGKMTSGPHGISMNFGRHVNSLDLEGFYKYAEKISVNQTHRDGLWMPCVFNKQQFIDYGMYPEQYIVNNMGADKYWFNLLDAQGKLIHITEYDSIIYHIQTGEVSDEINNK